MRFFPTIEASDIASSIFKNNYPLYLFPLLHRNNFINFTRLLATYH